jgi:hypothetical protein
MRWKEKRKSKIRGMEKEKGSESGQEERGQGADDTTN